MSQFIEMFGSVDDNPKSYDIKKVGDFAECFAGATPSTKISSYWDNGNIPWMSSGEVHKARVQDTDAKITQQGYDGCSTKMVPIHSIVIALAGQGKTRGTVAINDIELCTNQSLCAIVPNEEVNYEYLFHNLRGRYKELRSMSGDVDGRGGLNLKHIQSIKVIVPPMSEQMKFVSIARQADKSGFDGRKSQFIEMFDFHELNFNSPSKDFESICLDDTSSATKIPAAEYLQEGKYAVYDQAQEKDIAGYSNTEQGLCRNYPAVLFGDHSRVVKYINEPFFIGADGVKIIRPRKDNLIPEFLYYDLKYHNIPNTGYNRHFKYIKMISLTKASLEEQSQFLSIAHQADKSGSGGRESVALMGKVKKSLINYYNI